MLRRAKSEQGKDAGSPRTTTSAWATETPPGDALQPPERKLIFGTEH